MRKGAFTLVELMVVVTILSILATIGFVNFRSYLSGARDVSRMTQLKSMNDGLEIFKTKEFLPIPDNKVNILANGSLIGYQGYIGGSVLEAIEYPEKGLDPKDKTYFTYYLSENRNHFQLLGFLEEKNQDVTARSTLKSLSIIRPLQAADLSGRYPYVKGRKIGVLTDEYNSPVQEKSVVTSNGYLDIALTGDVYKSIIQNDIVITGTGSSLAFIEQTSSNGGKIYKSCKDILRRGASDGDGFYTIYPEYMAIEVYCDMTVAGGGWTLAVATYYSGASTGVGHLAGSDSYGSLSVTNTGSTGAPGGKYKLSDEDIKSVQALSVEDHNSDYLFNQIGYNTHYSGGNNEYITLENYTAEWNYGGKMENSTTDITLTSYRRSDGAVALTGLVNKNGSCNSGDFGINCNFQSTFGTGGGSSCDIDLRTPPANNLTWGGPMYLYMEATNADTYSYICNGAQHSSSNRYKARYFIRERD